MDDKLKIEVIEEYQNVDGFSAQPGFLRFIDKDNNVIAFSSGWENDGRFLLYEKEDRKWQGSWHDFNVSNYNGVSMEDIYQKQKEFEFHKACENGKGKDLFVSSEKFTFTDIYPGEKSNNGGEYGFYTSYIPTKVPGVYEVVSSSTCDFSDCETGFEGYVALTKDQYTALKADSDKVEALGSSYKDPGIQIEV